VTMVWEPFALAVLFGLLISAGIYFVVMWPQVAPDDDALAAAASPVEAVAAAADVPVAAVEPTAAAAPPAEAEPAAASAAPESPAAG